MAGLVVVWWRLGNAVHRGAVGIRWLLTTGALWALPLLLAPPLGSRDIYSYACQGAVYADGLDPYAVSALAGGCPWLDSVAPMWKDSTTPYGPVAVALSAFAVWLAGRWLPEGYAQLVLTIGLHRVLAIAGTAVLAWSVVRLARAPPAGSARQGCGRAGRRRGRRVRGRQRGDRLRARLGARPAGHQPGRAVDLRPDRSGHGRPVPGRRIDRSAGDTRTVVTHCGLAFAATAVLSPVFFPWYAVVPLALLAAAVWAWRRRPRSKLQRIRRVADATR